MKINFIKIRQLFHQKFKGKKMEFTKACIDLDHVLIWKIVDPKQRERHKTSAATLYRIAKALGVTMEELMIE